MNSSATFSDLSAVERAAALVDDGSLSPLPETDAGGSVFVGRGTLAKRPVLLALTDGHRRGGTVGVEEARAFARLTAAAAEQRPAAIIVCWDTGGVRVEEGSPALAAVAAVGVGLTRLSLLGVPVASVISGPRGCFGAPAVVAATAHATIVTGGAHWGLTGPTLLDRNGEPADEVAGRAATAAAHRVRSRQASRLVADSASAVRAALRAFLRQRLRRVGPARVLEASAARSAELLARLRAEGGAAAEVSAERGRRRDLFQYSFRGHWRPCGAEQRCGQVHAGWGEFNGRPAMAIVVGPERSSRGIGIEEADAVTRVVRSVVDARRRPRPPIVTFLFCRGHANELAEERAGLPSALAESLKSLVVARLLGHPLLCVLGGGAYGAAYLSLAAPSHRILAIRGTAVAPMAPKVLAAFRRLRGMRHAAETPRDLAQLIPEIRLVESIVRLPRALNEEWTAATQAARAEVTPSTRLLIAADR